MPKNIFVLAQDGAMILDVELEQDLDRVVGQQNRRGWKPALHVV